MQPAFNANDEAKRLLAEHQPRWWLWTELISVFLLSPWLLYWQSERLKPFVIELVFGCGFICLLVLLRDPKFKRFRLFHWPMFRRGLWHVAWTFLIGGSLLALAYWWLWQLPLFGLPNNLPWMWLALLFVYPVFSAWPQELVFRTFFFHRYKPILPNKVWRVLFSSISFGLAHLIFGNLWAVLLASLGGLLFALTYVRSRSTILVALEHSVWGLWCFTLGVGQFFDGGALTQGQY